MKVEVHSACGDTFTRAPEQFGQFDICVTNPPWEVLKPDRRELVTLSPAGTEDYITLLRQHDSLLRSLYPLSAPLKRFSGWGTNLARCGTELSLRLLAEGGVAGVVSPASLLGDQMFVNLRRWIFAEHGITDIAFYAAEARLFDKVDQTSITVVASRSEQNGTAPVLWSYGKDLARKSMVLSPEEWRGLANENWVVPLQFGLDLIRFQAKWQDLAKFVDLEGDGGEDLWAGRELDETGHQRFLSDIGEYLFMKGRMVRRFGLAEQPTKFVSAEGPRVPESADHYRLVWRDVARPNQKRRMHATIIPPGRVTGNSLNVAYFRDDDLLKLKALLAVVNSFVFEAQIRSYLATGHISLGSVRQVRVPTLNSGAQVRRLAELVDRCLSDDEEALVAVEVAAARIYGLDRTEFEQLLTSFPKLERDEVAQLLESPEWSWSSPTPDAVNDQLWKSTIPNHYSANLSKLDLIVARSVPPGGNWKNIPETVPSQRLKQIRISCAAGEGSRSTYYGRLHALAPSYTINTYFSRPGNGCHLHYDYAGGQHRVISQREAARLQSFPDSFVFLGNRGAVNQQIGNAVPPLLAYQIALLLPKPGQFVDLFSGAGGLALGFAWAGWKPIVANDIEDSFLATYRANIDQTTICGDIREETVFNSLISAIRDRRDKSIPLFVLGGPPCQGFSTAGNRRTMEDDRNWLFQQYKKVLTTVKPDGFVFENVTGLLNIEGGRVFQMVRSELLTEAKYVSGWKLRAEEYGVPQRRTRVILTGTAFERLAPPPTVTQLGDEQTLFGTLPPAITVSDALADLPPLAPGEDGSTYEYVSEPMHPYQELMRGKISASEYLEYLRAGVR
jgi:Alw26I/Eco31I/Esp3I family type II restriction m6 adenine DNA methyltransferase